MDSRRERPKIPTPPKNPPPSPPTPPNAVPDDWRPQPPPVLPHGAAPKPFPEYWAQAQYSPIDTADLNDAGPQDSDLESPDIGRQSTEGAAAGETEDEEADEEETDEEEADEEEADEEEARNIKAETKESRMFRYLAYDPFLFPSEANTQYELGDSLNKKQKETLEIITACHLYKSFMNAKKRTCRLLINAREDYDTLGAARHLAAKIMANPGFIREPSTIVIGWFCDIQGLVEYKDPSKPCHSRGMMAGLVCQLLDEMMGRNINCDLSFIRHAKWADIKSFNLQRLIKVFVTLMNQLPKESQVICVLDEIYHYVNWDARHDAFNAIRGLVALTEGKKLSADRYFKLVLTCRQEPLGVRRWFKDEGKIIDVKYRRKPRR